MAESLETRHQKPVKVAAHRQTVEELCPGCICVSNGNQGSGEGKGESPPQVAAAKGLQCNLIVLHLCHCHSPNFKQILSMY